MQFRSRGRIKQHCSSVLAAGIPLLIQAPRKVNVRSEIMPLTVAREASAGGYIGYRARLKICGSVSPKIRRHATVRTEGSKCA
jgi:hypothetical protein